VTSLSRIADKTVRMYGMAYLLKGVFDRNTWKEKHAKSPATLHRFGCRRDKPYKVLRHVCMYPSKSETNTDKLYKQKIDRNKGCTDLVSTDHMYQTRETWINK